MSSKEFDYGVYDLSTFQGRVIQPALESDRYIAAVGGLPEIERASADLRAALDQTKEEIETAVFAPRFSTYQTPRIREALEGNLLRISPATQYALEHEGEAGAKRVELMAEYTSVEAELGSLISRLVHLRANLVISKTEFDIDKAN